MQTHVPGRMRLVLKLLWMSGVINSQLTLPLWSSPHRALVSFPQSCIPGMRITALCSDGRDTLCPE